MRIRRGWHPHNLSITPIEPPDIVSSTPKAALPAPLTPIWLSTSFDSQEPYNHFSQSIGDNKKFTSLSVSHNHIVYPHKDQRLYDSPPGMNPGIGVGEEESSTEEKMSTTIDRSVNSDNCDSANSAETIAASSSVSSSLSRHVVIGHWCKEEKAFPLKKRKISLARFITQECIMDKDRKNKKKLVTKGPVTKKEDKTLAISEDETDNNEKEKKYEVEINSATAKRKDSTATMEESLRCNRSNGAGWRCSRRRLEGFALCANHLNQARTYRPRALSISKPENGRKYRGLDEHVDGRGEDGGKCIGVGKKRKKMMMSSILDRTVPLFANGESLGFKR